MVTLVSGFDGGLERRRWLLRLNEGRTSNIAFRDIYEINPRMTQRTPLYRIGDGLSIVRLAGFYDALGERQSKD